MCSIIFNSRLAFLFKTIKNDVRLIRLVKNVESKGRKSSPKMPKFCFF